MSTDTPVLQVSLLFRYLLATHLCGLSLSFLVVLDSILSAPHPSFLFLPSKSKNSYQVSEGPHGLSCEAFVLLLLGCHQSQNLIETFQAKTMFLLRRNSVPICKMMKWTTKTAFRGSPSGQITRQLSRTTTSGSQRA